MKAIYRKQIEDSKTTYFEINEGGPITQVDHYEDLYVKSYSVSQTKNLSPFRFEVFTKTGLKSNYKEFIEQLNKASRFIQQL
jgi:hypothetical protein